ncbi:hypothetical protein [Streptomyces sennicomposti]|uniref:hypothetical protein n=1 Tax=Streptomyces sennicomposti TaxID=2873384 RepID=UPI001CA72A69|nr:hypothetical protein [Streptomyces sennicomposti]MBY8865076.1 hypothetical protein [Streptomyces sennicomposti]
MAAKDTTAAGASTSVRASSGAAGSALAEASASAGGSSRAAVAAPRAGADPVKVLMRRHRDLCEHAVDPLEIAAGLEAHGVTDRTAARFRHRDVFSLAEEMYARIARDTETAPYPRPADEPRTGLVPFLLALLPGALCAAGLAGLRLTEGRTRLTVAAAAVLAVALAVRAVLRRGPLATGVRRPSGDRAPGARPPGTRAWTYWLVGYAALGDGLLDAAVGGGPDGLPDGTATGPWPLAAAPVLALALACAPAVLTAHLFAVRARRRLTASRGLDEFAASVRPLLLGLFALFLGALAALLAGCGAVLHEPAGQAQVLALGALLLLARLLTVHGFTHAPAVALGTAAAAEATAQASVFAGRLPGCDALAVPVDTVVTAWGPGGVPALACGAAALALLVHATRNLSRASAHARTEGQR